MAFQYKPQVQRKLSACYRKFERKHSEYKAFQRLGTHYERERKLKEELSQLAYFIKGLEWVLGE